MKLLWLCNIIPAAVQQKMDGNAGNGLWLDNMLRDLRRRGYTLHILCRGSHFSAGSLDENCSYTVFVENQPQIYEAALETLFEQEITRFQPDVIHIWGTEYGHTLAMVNAAERLNLLDRTVIGIQGLCSVIAGHYTEGIPQKVQRRGTLRDLLRRDTILQQQRKFILRGELERSALQKARHVIGRTHWDREWSFRINPEIQYHFCNETLRDVFYSDRWCYNRCVRHSVFASSCSYPIKGFHYLLEAMAEVVRRYPDASIYVTGDSFNSTGSWKGRLRQMGYQRYLSRLSKKYHLEEKIHFLGSLNPQQMKKAFLDANVFVLPSTIENSPNSLGEAMLLGVPCVAAGVGGVADMMQHEKEGFVYSSGEVHMLAHYIQQVFAMEDNAESLGENARVHALKTHDPKGNMDALMEIYNEIGSIQ